MTERPLPIGVDDFEMLITRGYYFIDKTLFIKELLDKKGVVNLFTRPRRFGKTLNMSMLRYFFEDTRDDNGVRKQHASLFQGLKITQEDKKYLKHMGQYPVITLTLKSAKQPDFESAYTMLARAVADEYRRHSFIIADEHLKEQKERYQQLMREQADRNSYSDSLKFLSDCLYKYYGQKVIILIDEYDVPLENAYLRNFYSEMTDFIHSLFESALKTNRSLEFAVLTGCLRISKESIFTGMNNLKVNSVLDNQYDEYFGFTDHEVKKICNDYNFPEKSDVIKEWYNGYLFGNVNVYNPWSVIQFVDDLREDIGQFPKSYWANTSSNSIVRKLIDYADEDTRAEIEELIEGKTIEKPVHEDITYDEVYKTIDNLWNFMFFTGYFRKVSERAEDGTNQRYVTLRIPNQEVRYIFRNKVLGWFEEKVRERDRSELFTAFANRDAETVEKEIQDMLMRTISFNDAYESFYHGFLAGVLSGMEGHIVKSNREGGRGRTDLFVKPVSRKKPAFVVEFKIASNMKELNRRADEALEQIEDREYDRELRDDGYDVVIRYGIAFYGKDCSVKVRV